MNDFISVKTEPCCTMPEVSASKMRQGEAFGQNDKVNIMTHSRFFPAEADRK